MKVLESLAAVLALGASLACGAAVLDVQREIDAAAERGGGVDVACSAA